MRKLTLYYKTFFYSFLVLILLGGSYISFPSAIVFSAGSEVPTITIKSPAANFVFDSRHVVISGTYTDNVPMANLRFSATIQGSASPISDSVSNHPEEWTIDDSGAEKTWTYTTTFLDEGTHDVTIKVEEISPIDPTMVASATTAFSIALTRPYVNGTGIVLADGTVRTGEDLTSVPLDAQIKMTVVDDQPMTNLKNKTKPSPFQPIKIMVGTNTVTGSTDVSDLGVQNGKYTYDIVFTPDPSTMQLNKTYFVYLDPGVIDDLDNPVFTRFFKFTTKSDPAGDDPSNPHGHFKLNTNMCSTCHSTHDSKYNPFLIGGSNQITFNEQLTKNQPAGNPSQNYCMACHDGTTNAPFDKTNGFHHASPIDAASEAQALKQPDSCTSCHNPHLERSETNQNLLKDHYVYTHNAAHPEKGLVDATVDSLDTTCDTCHESSIDYSSISADKGKLELLKYNKSSTAVAKILPDSTISDDYSLCLRCHNLKKKNQTNVKADIESYYLDPTSGHNFTLPGSETTHKDGSILDGPIPCAECHETHGSNNLYNLRELLGNNALQSDADKFSTVGTDWTDNERTFCMKCHNQNQGIEIYGKKATLQDKNSAGDPITGHQSTDVQTCSTCHGGSFIKTAHDPQPGVKP